MQVGCADTSQREQKLLAKTGRIWAAKPWVQNQSDESRQGTDRFEQGTDRLGRERMDSDRDQAKLDIGQKATESTHTDRTDRKQIGHPRHKKRTGYRKPRQIKERPEGFGLWSVWLLKGTSTGRGAPTILAAAKRGGKRKRKLKLKKNTKKQKQKTEKTGRL